MSYDRLTPREKQVLDLLMDGYRMKVIADKLGLKYLTIKRYMERIEDCYRVPKRNGPFYKPVRLIYLRALELGLVGGSN